MVVGEVTPCTWIVAPLASLGVGDGYQWWGWLASVRGHGYICGCFACLHRHASCEYCGVVLPTMTSFAPFASKKVSIGLFEVLNNLIWVLRVVTG